MARKQATVFRAFLVGISLTVGIVVAKSIDEAARPAPEEASLPATACSAPDIPPMPGTSEQVWRARSQDSQQARLRQDAQRIHMEHEDRHGLVPISSIVPHGWDVSEHDNAELAVSEKERRMLLTWTADEQDGDGNGVFGRMFDLHGTPLSDEFQVNTEWSGDQYGSTTIKVNDSLFAVFWTSNAHTIDTVKYHLTVQFIAAADGHFVGEETRMSPPYTEVQITRATTLPGGEGVAIVCRCTAAGDTETFTLLQVAYANGTISSAVRLVHPTNTDFHPRDAVADVTGSVVVAYVTPSANCIGRFGVPYGERLWSTCVGTAYNGATVSVLDDGLILFRLRDSNDNQFFQKYEPITGLPYGGMVRYSLSDSYSSYPSCLVVLPNVGLALLVLQWNGKTCSPPIGQVQAVMFNTTTMLAVDSPYPLGAIWDEDIFQPYDVTSFACAHVQSENRLALGWDLSEYNTLKTHVVMLDQYMIV